MGGRTFSIFEERGRGHWAPSHARARLSRPLAAHQVSWLVYSTLRQMTSGGKRWRERLLVYCCLNPLASFIADWRLWLGAATATMMAVASQLDTNVYTPFLFGTLGLFLSCAYVLLTGATVRDGAARAFSVAVVLVPVQLLHLAVSNPSTALVDELHIVLGGGWQLNAQRVALVGCGNFLVGWSLSSSPLPRLESPVPPWHCFLLTARCSLPAAHCPLPAAPLPAARCPLSTARCLRQVGAGNVQRSLLCHGHSS